MPSPAPRIRDQRWTDRTFHELTRQLRPDSPAVRRWRSGPTDARDERITAHGDRRSVPTVAAATGSLVLALAGLIIGDLHLAVAMALLGFAGSSLLGADHARTHLTVTEDGRVEVGNGVHRRTTTVPAIAVAGVRVGHGPTSRWSLRRPVGELILHTGDRIPVRALAHDPSHEAGRERAVWLARSIVRALEAAGAALDTRRV